METGLRPGLSLCFTLMRGFLIIRSRKLRWARHYGFMHNVEMWVRTCVCVVGAQVGFRVGYDIPKNVGMTMARAKGEAWCFSF